MEAVFFDLDGTLLDTAPDIRAALNRALTACGYAAIGETETVAFVGNGARKLIERAAPGGDYEKVSISSPARMRACRRSPQGSKRAA